MARYFRIIEIDSDSFIRATGEDLEYYRQIVIPTGDAVYVAVDADEEDEISVDLENFDK